MLFLRQHTILHSPVARKHYSTSHEGVDHAIAAPVVHTVQCAQFAECSPAQIRTRSKYSTTLQYEIAQHSASTLQYSIQYCTNSNVDIQYNCNAIQYIQYVAIGAPRSIRPQSGSPASADFSSDLKTLPCAKRLCVACPQDVLTNACLLCVSAPPLSPSFLRDGVPCSH